MSHYHQIQRTLLKIKENILSNVLVSINENTVSNLPILDEACFISDGSRGKHLAQLQGERIVTSILLLKKVACCFCTFSPVTFPLCLFQTFLEFLQ